MFLVWAKEIVLLFNLMCPHLQKGVILKPFILCSQGVGKPIDILNTRLHDTSRASVKTGLADSLAKLEYLNLFITIGQFLWPVFSSRPLLSTQLRSVKLVNLPVKAKKHVN